MAGAVYVVVSGPPGSGKSTLAPGLAMALGLPLVAKDAIKESLMEAIDVPDVGSSRLMGRAAIAVMWAIAHDSPVGAVLDCNVHRTPARHDIDALPGRVVEVFCRCDREVALLRYQQRSGSRHPGHFDEDRSAADLWDPEVSEPVAGEWPVVEVDTNRPSDPWQVAALVRRALKAPTAAVDDPVLAVVAPHRVARFRQLTGIGIDEPVDANFTGWSKLVLLSRELAILVPRNHHQIEPLRREVTALRLLADVGLPAIPRLRDLVEDDELSPYPIAVCDRMPGSPLADVIETMASDDLVALFDQLGRQAARWHEVPTSGVDLRRGDSFEPTARLAEELASSPTEQRRTVSAIEQARVLAPVLVHGDLHEGQLLVDPDRPRTITGIIDWQTARIDHPFVEFDLGEWGTAMWRAHRTSFPELRRRAWAAYADERGLPGGLAGVFQRFHAASHAARLLGRRDFPVDHQPGITGTLDEARIALRATLAALDDP